MLSLIADMKHWVLCQRIVKILSSTSKFKIQTGNMTHDPHSLLQVSNLRTKGASPTFSFSHLLGGDAHLFPFMIFPFLRQSVSLTHGLLSFGTISATLSLQTRTYRHRSSVCQCITLKSLRHSVHIYGFITTKSFVWEKPLDPSAFSALPSGLDFSVQPSCRLPVCFTSNPFARQSISQRNKA